MDWFLEPRNSLSRPAVVLYISSGYLYFFVLFLLLEEIRCRHQLRSVDSIDRKYLWDAQQKCWLNNIEIRRGIRLMNADSLVSRFIHQCQCQHYSAVTILRWNKRFSLRERDSILIFPTTFCLMKPIVSAVSYIYMLLVCTYVCSLVRL